MFDSILKNKKELKPVMKEIKITSAEEEWKLIKFLCDLLKVLADGIKYLEGENYTTINCVLPAINIIATKWNSMKTNKFSGHQ